jgi:imidazolonepropionase-like amidohydrolase
MKKLSLGLLAGASLFIGLFTNVALAGEIVVVHAGTLLAVPGQAPQTQQSIIIADGKIRQVVAGYVEPQSQIGEGDALIASYDLKDKFVLPGMIDSHVHLTAELNPRGRLEAVEMSDPDRAILAAGYAHKTLMAGFTTVRDVGARGGDAIFALRDGIEKGLVVGPRIYASGSTISVTGGHGDGTQGYRDDIAHMMMSSGVCDGAAECRKAVREQVRRGADHIKLTATGGVLSNTAAGLGQQFFNDELEAIMDTAHSMGRRVTAHAHGADGINSALRAGVDSIEHGTYLDNESIRLFKRKGAYLVPTILAGVTVTEWANDPNGFLLPAQREKAKQVGPRMLEMTGKAHEAGVKIAFGTDSGVSAHGENARELALLVEAGMTPMEALQSATLMAADNMGQGDHFGKITPGLAADIIAVDGDPLSDISVMMDIAFVMKDGVVYKGD